MFCILAMRCFLHFIERFCGLIVVGLGWKERIGRFDAKNGDRDISIFSWLETLIKACLNYQPTPSKTASRQLNTNISNPVDQ